MTNPKLPETQRERRGHAFYPPADAGIPGLYDTERQPLADKVLHLHYFAGGCDWWIAEYDPTNGIAFGYACLGHPQDAEWGYISLPELEQISIRNGLLVVERDLDWTPRPASEANLPQ